MVRLSLVMLVLLVACARNRDSGAGETRVRDTTADTLDRIRPAIPDTAGGLDTTSRR